MNDVKKMKIGITANFISSLCFFAATAVVIIQGKNYAGGFFFLIAATCMGVSGVINLRKYNHQK